MCGISCGRPATEDSRDLIWIERLHSQLRACFSGSEAAFDYLDAFGQGALDAAHFADGMLRLMSDGAQSYGLDTQGGYAHSLACGLVARGACGRWSGGRHSSLGAPPIL